MMQLLCNGVQLDLYDNAGLQFEHENPLFAFDNLKCERTTQFKLPSTPNNDGVLSLARIPAYDGVGMRQKFTAQMVDGVVVKDGYLYVSSFDGKDYAAIFVTGELIGLQAIKDLGKIPEIMSYPDVVTVGTTPTTPTNARGTLFANVAYSKPAGDTLVPSIELKSLYDSIVTQYSLNAQAFPVSLYGMRIVPPAAKGVNEMQEFKCTIDATQRTLQPDATQPTTNYNTLQYDSRLFEYEDVPYGIAVNKAGDTSSNQYYLVRVYKTKTALKLTMPETMSYRSYIYDFVNLDFIGGYSFDKDFDGTTTRTGTPLAGRTIELAAGTAFAFVDERYYIYTRVSVMGTNYYNRGFFLDNENVGVDFNTDYMIKVQSVNNPLVNGDLCRLQDNLPNISFTELCKTIAALCGCVLNYDEANGLTFEPLVLSGYPVKEVKELTKRGEVTRTFADYVQRNIVQFESNEGVTEKLSVVYTINNDNLAEENELLTMPFSEGESLNGSLRIEGKLETPTLGADGGGSALEKVTLTSIAGLQQLCNASTQFKVSAHMLLMEYNAITAKTLLQVDGSVYAWTSRSWQKDAAQFTLARI